MASSLVAPAPKATPRQVAFEPVQQPRHGLFQRLHRWINGEARRERIGGLWYLVRDSSAGWPVSYWTQTPEPSEAVIRTVGYEFNR